MSEKPIKLGEAVEFIRGVTFDKSQQQAIPSESYFPVLRAGNIQDSLDTKRDLIFVPREIVSESQLLRKGDIAISLSSGSPKIVGKTASLDHDWLGTVGGFCGIIRAKKVNPDFLAHWMRGPKFIDWRDGQARGANIQNLRFSELGKLEVCFPSPDKQRQIAARLKAQLAEVDKARQAAEVQLRELHLALNQIIEEQITGVIEKGGKAVNLGEVSSITAKIVDPMRPEYCDLPHVSAENIETMTGRLINIQSAKEDGMTSGKYLFDEGDILYSKLRPYLRGCLQKQVQSWAVNFTYGGQSRWANAVDRQSLAQNIAPH